jgi:hypothetical protein
LLLDTNGTSTAAPETLVLRMPNAKVELVILVTFTLGIPLNQSSKG